MICVMYFLLLFFSQSRMKDITTLIYTMNYKMGTRREHNYFESVLYHSTK